MQVTLTGNPQAPETPAATRTAGWGWSLRLLWIPAACLLLVGLSRVLYPYGLGVSEANNWEPAHLIATLHSPYSLWGATHPPYVDPIFGPFFYLVLGVTLRIAGYQFWLFRLLTLGFAAVIAWSLAVIARNVTGRRWAGYMAAGLFAAQWPVQGWIGVQRPDLLAIACGTAAIAVVCARGIETAPGPRRAAAAGLLASAGALSRQTEVLPMLVILSLLLLVIRSRRDATVFAVTVAVAAGGTVLTLLLLSHGAAWNMLVQGPARAHRSLPVLAHLLRSAAKSPVTWVSLVLLGFGVRRLASDRFGRIMLGYLLGAAAIGLAHASTTGGSINDLLEVFTVLALVAAIGLARRSPAGPPGGSLVPAAVAVAAVIGIVPNLHGEVLRWRAIPYFDDLVATLRRVTPPHAVVLSEMQDLAVAADRTYYFNETVVFNRTAQLRRIYRQALASGEFAAIVVFPASAHIVPAGYRRVTLRTPVPRGVYWLELYVRSPATSA